MVFLGAHHQNGEVEKRIRDIVDQARTMLLHAAHRWLQAVSTALWPYALHHAVKLRNNISTSLDASTPLSKFCGSTVKNNVFWKHQHTFGCPTFVLDAPLQGSIGGKPKWSEKSRVGVYLGHSSQHSSTVALVLNPKTGHVSPQFHIVFDNTFDTVKQDMDFESLWQEKSNMVDQLSETVAVDIPDSHFKEQWLMESIEPKPITITSPSTEGNNSNSEANAQTPSQSPTIVEDDMVPQNQSPMTPSPLTETNRGRIFFIWN